MENKNKILNEILSKFDNGIELYQTNNLFANCVNLLLRGADVYRILEQVIVTQTEQQKYFSDIIENGKIRQEIVVSAEKFQELLNQTESKDETTKKA